MLPILAPNNNTDYSLCNTPCQDTPEYSCGGQVGQERIYNIYGHDLDYFQYFRIVVHVHNGLINNYLVNNYLVNNYLVDNYLVDNHLVDNYLVDNDLIIIGRKFINNRHNFVIFINIYHDLPILFHLFYLFYVSHLFNPFYFFNLFDLFNLFNLVDVGYTFVSAVNILGTIINIRHNFIVIQSFNLVIIDPVALINFVCFDIIGILDIFNFFHELFFHQLDYCLVFVDYCCAFKPLRYFDSTINIDSRQYIWVVYSKFDDIKGVRNV
ncbi:hypothetical protein C8035_v007037 [Colletotrichum spinosum]|uniref:Uncharacterized protein n=1 Tax=Colletotrichum spinosum TaxID=1347390 RepID=A0A4R8QJW3_9PEZI|nr:hypothetical protein C8035_v007037 [Colletotrichum spinosum]